MRTILLGGIILFGIGSCESLNGSSEKTLQNTQQYAAILEPSLDSSEIKEYHDAIDHYLNSGFLKWNHFNGGILIAKEGTVVYEKYVGYKDLRTKEPLEATTPLQIASTSKTFTGAAVLRLVQEGKLQLNTPVDQIFPGFPYPGVTVKMLLNHRSGLPNYLHYLEGGKWNKKIFLTNNDVLQTLINLRPARAYKPDTRFQYCNTNYVVLALIIEKFSGQTYPEYLRTSFFEPLKMNNTYVYVLSDTLKSTQSYNAGGGIWAMDYTDGPYGDKNIYSTPRDLLKWDQALYSNAVINQQLLDSAFTPYSHEKPGVHNYGLGFRLLMFKNGKKVVYHNGRWHGFNAAFSRLTDEKATIIILGNKFNSGIYSTARKLYNIFGPYDEDGSMSLEESGNKEQQ